jgi:hypothetical protein
VVDHRYSGSRCGADALVYGDKFSVAAFGQHDGLAADGIGTDLDRPAAGEGPVYCGDLGDEGSWGRIRYGRPGLGPSGHKER